MTTSNHNVLPRGRKKVEKTDHTVLYTVIIFIDWEFGSSKSRESLMILKHNNNNQRKKFLQEDQVSNSFFFASDFIRRKFAIEIGFVALLFPLKKGYTMYAHIVEE